ncbi:MAG TPA: mechanosensitive ion channel domain-containing protein [Dyella sp.]|uniref:mechanosensitive ion channel family protein n=1 Tax=Dyella sp. TaxID=1869338 RepID=UPI002F952936
MHDYLKRLDLSESSIALILNLVAALVILVVGLWAAGRVTNFASRAMTRARFDPTLIGFLRNLAHGALIAMLIVAALTKAGVPFAPMAAALGAASLAIGLSLQGSLSNLAWGVLLILFRPFRVGDFIRAGGIDGTVESINLMHTVLVLADNREAVVPNAKVGSDAIINFNRRGTRRFELRVGIGYDDDIGKAMALVDALFQADERILKSPAPGVFTEALADSSVTLLIRAFVRTDEFWAVQTDMLRKVKERFLAEGITIPFPQRELRVVQGVAVMGDERGS